MLHYSTQREEGHKTGLTIGLKGMLNGPRTELSKVMDVLNTCSSTRGNKQPLDAGIDVSSGHLGSDRSLCKVPIGLEQDLVSHGTGISTKIPSFETFCSVRENVYRFANSCKCRFLSGKWIVYTDAIRIISLTG